MKKTSHRNKGDVNNKKLAVVFVVLIAVVLGSVFISGNLSSISNPAGEFTGPSSGKINLSASGFSCVGPDTKEYFNRSKGLITITDSAGNEIEKRASFCSTYPGEKDYLITHYCQNGKFAYEKYKCPGGCEGGKCKCASSSEICDGIDNNCNGLVDEGCGANVDGYPECKILYGNSQNKNNINIIFYPGDGYGDYSNFKSEVLSDIDFEGRNEGFFYYEPFKSYKDKFNIYIVTHQPTSYGTPSSVYPDGGKYRLEMTKYCPDSIVDIIIQNHSPCGGGQSYGDYGITIGSACCGVDSSVSITRERWNAICVHEALGHGFAYLHDEYQRWNLNITKQERDSFVRTQPNVDVAGCPKWCSGAYAFPPEKYNSTCLQKKTKAECENTYSKDFWNARCVWVGNGEVIGFLDEYFGSISCVPPYDFTQRIGVPKQEGVDIGVNCVGNSGCCFGNDLGINMWRPCDGNVMTGGEITFGNADIEQIKNIIDCCYPADCNNYNAEKCTKFANSLPDSARFSKCNMNGVCMPQCSEQNRNQKVGDLYCTCTNGKWDWKASITKETCDGVDNNCNGVIDEGCGKQAYCVKMLTSYSSVSQKAGGCGDVQCNMNWCKNSGYNTPTTCDTWDKWIGLPNGATVCNYYTEYRCIEDKYLSGCMPLTTQTFCKEGYITEYDHDVNGNVVYSVNNCIADPNLAHA